MQYDKKFEDHNCGQGGSGISCTREEKPITSETDIGPTEVAGLDDNTALTKERHIQQQFFDKKM